MTSNNSARMKRPLRTHEVVSLRTHEAINSARMELTLMTGHTTAIMSTSEPRYPYHFRRFRNSVFARLTEEFLFALKVTVCKGGFFPEIERKAAGPGRDSPSLFPAASRFLPLSNLLEAEIALRSLQSDDLAQQRTEHGVRPERSSDPPWLYASIQYSSAAPGTQYA